MAVKPLRAPRAQSNATSGLGVSKTNMNQVSGGALQNIMNNPEQVRELGKALMPAQKSMGDYLTEKDKWLVAFKFFTDMAAQSSKPGATALGAAGAAGSGAVDFATGIAKSKREEDLAATQLGAGLIGKLAKPKTGVPKAVDMGPVTIEDGSPKIDATTGRQLHTFNVFNADGSLRSTYEAVPKGGQTITVGSKEEDAFGRESGKRFSKQWSDNIEGSQKAFGAISSLDTILTLLNDRNFETGAWQGAIMPLKSLLVSLPESIREPLGVSQKDIDSVASANAFQSIGFQIVLAKVEQMKGALSDKELDFLKAMAPSLSTSKDGNRLITALAMHQLGKATKFNDFQLNWQDKNGPIKTSLDYQKMANEFRKQDFMAENPYQYIERISKEEIKKRVIAAGGSVDQNNDISDIDNSTVASISNSVREKYGLSQLKRIFKDRTDKDKRFW